MGFPAFLALIETIAVVVHLQDMDMVGEPVEQCPGQAFGAEHLGSLVEGQIAGHQGGAAFVTFAKHLEQELGAGLGQRHEAEFVDDQRLYFANCFWKRSRRFSSLASISSWTRVAALVNPTDNPFWQAARPRPTAPGFFRCLNCPAR